MTDYAFKVISEIDAADAVVRSKGHFVPWIGAGVSIESRIPGAATIRDEMVKQILTRIQLERQLNHKPPLSDDEISEYLEDELIWQDRTTQYARAIMHRYPGKADRVDYFRRLVADRAPCFAHYATALLIRQKIFASDCITTNFDKLLERAFHDIGTIECQPIRNVDEIRFHQQADDKAFCLKIHGDYDTHNLLNTEDETFIIDQEFSGCVEDVLKNKGALVLGSAGEEKSIHTLFDKLTSKEAITRGILQYGLLWGVYVGDDAADPEAAVRRAIREGVVSRQIVKVMDRNFRGAIPFAFFPVIGGAGEFLRKLIQYSDDKQLIRSAEPYLDHEMRIKAIFRKQNLSLKAALQHIERLRKAQRDIEKVALPSEPIWVDKERKVADRPFVLSLCYGSLADPRLLSDGKNGGGRAGVLSPDDTFISIGGGTALAIAKAAGYRNIVHDVSKLAPIPLGDVAVTTAGNLPVEYVLHGAAVRIDEDGISWSDDSIRDTVQKALTRGLALGIDTLFVPLLAAGTAGAKPEDSIFHIFRAIAEFDPARELFSVMADRIRIIIVVFQEAVLPRHVYDQKLGEVFGRHSAPATLHS